MPPTARKVSIKWLQDSEFFRSDNGSYITTPLEQKLELARVLATVISKEEHGAYSMLVLDDGSDTISAKFLEPCRLSVGDTADFFAIPKESEEKKYLLVTLARKVSDPNFECLRRLELLQIKKSMKSNAKASTRPPTQKETTSEKPGMKKETASETPATASAVDLKKTIIELINSSSSGMPYETILTSNIGFNEQQIENAVRDLLNRGEIYEPKIGIYKRLS